MIRIKVCGLSDIAVQVLKLCRSIPNIYGDHIDLLAGVEKMDR